MRIIMLLILLFVSQEAFTTENKGIVYILTNKGNAYLKIGKTKREIEKRRKELSRPTGVATEFKVYFAKKVENYDKVEIALHEKFDKFRVPSNKEFFDIKPEIAYDALNEYDGLVVFKRERRSNFSFSELGIKIGEELQYEDDKRIVATVIGDKSVMYKEEEYSLSGLTAELLGKKDSSGIQALDYWFYKDELLSDIREEQDKK